MDNYRILNSIDYSGGNEPPAVLEFETPKVRKKKFPIALLCLWIFSASMLFVSVFFNTTSSSRDVNRLRNGMVFALSEVIQNENITLDDKFLKKFDKFLYKRKGWFVVNYEIDFIAWTVLTCQIFTLWLSTSIILSKKMISRGKC